MGDNIFKAAWRYVTSGTDWIDDMLITSSLFFIAQGLMALVIIIQTNIPEALILFPFAILVTGVINLWIVTAISGILLSLQSPEYKLLTLLVHVLAMFTPFFVCMMYLVFKNSKLISWYMVFMACTAVLAIASIPFFR